MSRTRRALLAVAAAAPIALAVTRLWPAPAGRCYDTYRAFDREAIGVDGLRHYLPDGCEIDENGYRNASVPQHADIVAVGDSNTWGGNARLDATWPRVLARETGLSSYNLSMPGWGPIDFLVAMPRALSLTPRYVVIGFYMGNDMYDAYARVVAHPDAYGPVTVSFAVPPEISDDPIWKTAELEARAAGVIADSIWTADDFLAVENRDPNRVRVITIDGTRICITAHYRLLGVSLDEPRIRYGLGVAKTALAMLDEQARAGGARLVVVIQPSKEFVYCPLVAADQMSADWMNVCRFEGALTAQVEETLRRRSIPYANAVEELRAAAQRGEALYSWGDSHLDEPGMKLMGRAARRAMQINTVHSD